MSSLLIALPLAVLGVLTYAGRARYGWRTAGLAACAVTGALLVLFTELLSSLRAISPGPVVLAWGLAAAGGIALLRPFSGSRAAGSLREWAAREHVLLVAPTAILLCITLTTALIAAPNTIDSLTYHMARVAHWEQNRSVAPYPTPNLRQLHLGPFAEYAILHLQVLTGTDIFANLVQWGAILGVALGVSLLARILGAGRRGQLLAAFIAVSTPMAVAQASSTQTDAVAAFWLVAFIALAADGFGLHREDGTRRWLEWGVLGACLGLAGLTKATTYLFGFPIVVWFVATRWKRGPRTLVPALGLIFGVALVLNLPFFARNLQVEGSPLGAGKEGDLAYANESHGPGAIASNIVRNVALQVGTPSHAVNVRIDSIITRSLRRLNIDADDPRTTWSGTKFSVGFCANDGCAENPVQFLLAAICFGLVLFRRRPAGDLRERDLALIVVTGFLLFCAVLKWQPWHSRLQLPLFMLAAPVVAVMLDRRLSNRLLSVVVGTMLLSAIAVPLLEPLRPMRGPHSVFHLSREQSYFGSDPAAAVPFRRVIQGIADAGCERVGLITGSNAPEYPLWVFAQKRLRSVPEMRHVAVTNPSAALYAQEPFRSFQPCAIVTLGEPMAQAIRVGNARFERAESAVSDPQLYLPAGDRPR